MLKLLFPSWAFFDSSGDNIEIQTRSIESNFPWRSMPTPPPRKPWHVLLNERHNHYLYTYSLADRLIDVLDSIQGSNLAGSGEYLRLKEILKQSIPGNFNIRIILHSNTESKEIIFSDENWNLS